jgi:hypothetical protein
MPLRHSEKQAQILRGNMQNVETKINRLLVFTVLMTLALPCIGQSHPSSTYGHSEISSPTSQLEIPTHVLDFEGANPVPGLAASPFIVLPTQCSSDGTLYLDMLDPSDPRQHIFYGIEEDRSVPFTATSISDLHDVEFISAYATSSMVGFLVRAAKENGQAQRTVKEGNDKTSTVVINPNQHHFYIAEFNLDGVYKQSIELPIQGPIYHFAILSSGEFLATAYDSTTDAPQLFLFSSAGDILRQIYMPNTTNAKTKQSNRRPVNPLMASARLMGSILFTPYGDDVLVWQAGVNAPILEVQPGGSVRELHISAPKGYVLAGMVPSNDRLVAQFQPINLDTSVAQNESEYMYYEINPSDGSLLNQLKITGNHAGTIACEHDGDYLSFQINAKNQLTLLTTQ